MNADVILLLIIAGTAAHIIGRCIGWLIRVHREPDTPNLYDYFSPFVMATLTIIAVRYLGAEQMGWATLYMLAAVAMPWAVQQASEWTAPRWRAVNLEVSI